MEIYLATEHAYHFIWTYHHLLLDAWAARLVYAEVHAFYEAFRRGETLDLPVPRAYREYVVWLQRQSHQQAADFWQAQLGGIDAPTTLYGAPAAADQPR